MNLYEITQELRAIDAIIESMDGELPEDLERLLDDYEAKLSDKVDNLVCWMREHEARAMAFGEEEKRFQAKRKQAENAARRIKQYVQDSMRQRQVDRIDTDRFVVRIQRNSAPHIEWQSADPIPEQYVRTIVEPDGKAIQEAHRKGSLPDGFVVSYGSHLRIK